MNINLTEIISAVIALLSAVVTGFLVPYLKSKIGTEKLANYLQYVDIAVAAAEQLFDVTDGEAKKRYVIEYLNSKGIKFDEATVDRMIEAAVLRLHNEIKKKDGVVNE